LYLRVRFSPLPDGSPLLSAADCCRRLLALFYFTPVYLNCGFLPVLFFSSMKKQ
jgi:hypothetical protein